MPLLKRAATAFLIVPPRLYKFSPATLADIEGALSVALPEFRFKVAVDHPGQQDDDFFVEPNGQVSESIIEMLAFALAPFTDLRPPKLQ